MALGLDPLILTGNLKLGTTTSTLFEVGDNVTAFKITGARAIVEIPSTLATVTASKRAGSATYEIQIDYLSNDDASTTSVFNLLWGQLDDVTAGVEGYIYYEGSMESGSVSTSNPRWSGAAIVTQAALGGTANELAQDSVTFPCVTRPTRANT